MAENETKVVFLDKRHAPFNEFFEVNVASQLIDRHMAWGMPYCKLHLIPGFASETIPEYPFNYEFVA